MAHRGCAGQFPQNTLQAIRRSGPHVEHVELDVRRCGSGELVVFHDELLGAKTNISGFLAETDISELRDCKVENTDEGIPLLSEALEALPEMVGVELDLKTHGIATEAVQIAPGAGVPTLILAGDWSIVSDAIDVVDVPVGYVVDRSSLEEDVRSADEIGCEFVYVAYDLCANPELINRIHEFGLAVNAGTIRTADAADRYVDRLREANVDYLSVDRCDWDLE